MDKFVIEGEHTLTGEVMVSGAKNAVLPLMAASLLWPDRYILHNVPRLRDTLTMARLLEIIGAVISFEGHRMEIDTTACNNPIAPYELVKTMRASFYVLGPLTARFGRCRVSLPGGCNWGPRPVDLHLMALERMGIEVTLDGGYITTKGRLRGCTINFGTSSVGASGNALMAAVRAEGETVLSNVAIEPEITALARFLQKMGAHIEGIGTPTLRIIGQTELHGAEEEIIPDRIEAGTFLIAGAIAGDRVRVKGACKEHLTALLEKLETAGAKLKLSDDYLEVTRSGAIQPMDVITAPYPNYPTDLQAQWIAFMTQSEGKSIVRDDVYPDRFTHVSELNRLGAHIEMNGNVAVVQGPSRLVGAPVMSTDIRASASLLLAALVARGTSEISRVYHLDRGYETIETKFAALGARIERIHED